MFFLSLTSAQPTFAEMAGKLCLGFVERLIKMFLGQLHKLWLLPVGLQ